MVKGGTNLPYEIDEERITVVRNLPALVCARCGDDFAEMDVLRNVEKIVDRLGCDGMIMSFVECKKAAQKNMENSNIHWERPRPSNEPDVQKYF